MATKKCDFCGKKYTEEELRENNIMVYRSKVENEHGERIKICSNCLARGYEMYEERQKVLAEEEEEKARAEINTPRDIKAYLDDWVIEQERPKITVATEIYAHKKRIQRLEEHPEEAKKLRMDKSNIIFLGPSGTGKSETIRAICSCLDLPYTIQDASSFTASGLIF